MASTKGLVDVQAFIASFVPLLNSLGGDDAFWYMNHYIDWAYDGLINILSSNAKSTGNTRIER
jgi:hypothetical protein